MWSRAAALALVALACVPAGALGQDYSKDVLQPDAFEDDPIGIGATSDLANVQPAATASTRANDDRNAGPKPPDVAVRKGEVVQAVGPVHETAHQVRVTLAEGLARGDEVMELANVGSYPAEVRYRLAMPDDAELVSFAVCVDGRCRAGRRIEENDGAAARAAYDAAVRSRPTAGTNPLPVGYASRVHDGSGTAAMLYAAPVPARGALEVRVSWLAAAPLRGGTVRLTLPARGIDPRAAPASVTVRARGLLSPTVDGMSTDHGAVTVDPSVSAHVLALQATATKPSATLWRFRCGERWCVRARVAAGLRPGPPRDLLLLVDVSPSTEGPARGRMAPTLAALLATAPDGSRVRALAFAARTRIIVGRSTPVTQTPLAPFVTALDWSLGDATRFEAAWALLRRWAAESRRDGRDPLVVLIGDGGLTQSERATRAMAEAARLGVPVDAVDVGDVPPRPALERGIDRAGGRVLQVGAEAEQARLGHRTEPLEERLDALFAPTTLARLALHAGGRRIELGPLPAGEERVYEGPIRGRSTWLGAPGIRVTARNAGPAVGHAFAARVEREGGAAPATVFVALAAQDLSLPAPTGCSELGPAHRPSGISSDAAPVVLAESRACPKRHEALGRIDTQVHSPLEGKGVPAHTVLDMLRQRVIPVARRCLRRDRRGRMNYSVHAAFVFRLAEREVVEAHVEGHIPEPLRRCLLGAIDDLDIPTFSGVVAVRYPIHTDRAPEPPVIELEPTTAEAVDKVTRGYSDRP